MNKKIKPIFGFLPTAPLILFYACAIFITLFQPASGSLGNAIHGAIIVIALILIGLTLLPGIFFSIAINTSNKNRNNRSLLIISHICHGLYDAGLVVTLISMISSCLQSLHRDNFNMSQPLLVIALIIGLVYFNFTYIAINMLLQKGQQKR